MRMRKKPNLAPRLERCSHLLIPEPGQVRGVWLETFPFDELHLEIGCGKGRFVAETALNCPDILFVAMEKTANVLVSALEYAVRENVQNVRYINANAENLTAIFATDEVSRIYINFCDPWPSNRHRKRRIVGRDFLQMYATVLRTGGEIHFKTDNLPLYEFSLKEFECCGFSIPDSTRDLHKSEFRGIMTEYEQRFAGQNLPIYYCRALRDKTVYENGNL